MGTTQTRPTRGLPTVLQAVGLTTFGPMPAFFLGGLAVLVRRDLSFSEAQLGALIATFFAAGVVGSATTGRLTDRIGARSALRGGLTGTVCALVAAAAAQTWWHLGLALVVGGLSHSVLQVGSNLLLATDVPLDRQGLAFGVKQAAIPLATLTAGAAVPAIGTHLGWRWAYVGAALGATLALRLAAGLRVDVAASRRPLPATTDHPFRRNELLMLAGAVGLAAASANALASFLVEFATHTGVTVGVAGTLLAVASSLGVAVRVTVGWLADARPSTDLGGVALLLLTGAVGFAMLPLAPDSAALLWGAAAVAFAAGWGWPGLFTFLVARENAHAPASATGVTQAGIFTGAVAGPLLFGLGITTVGYTTMWRVAALTQLAGALLVLHVRRGRRRPRGRNAPAEHPGTA